MSVHPKLMLLLLVTASFGCASDEEVPEADVTCAKMVETAAFETEPEDQIRGLDAAIKGCLAYDDLAAEMDKYPYIVGYSVEDFIDKRCRDEADDLGDTGVCLVAVPPAVAASPDAPPYTGLTLDGESITVTDEEVEFVGDVPEAVQRSHDLAKDASCVSVLGLRDDYAQFAGDTREGKIASMYARQAQDVADYIGCVNESLITDESSDDESSDNDE